MASIMKANANAVALQQAGHAGLVPQQCARAAAGSRMSTAAPRPAQPRCTCGQWHGSRVSCAASASADGQEEEIYIGFPKGDYDRSAGRKGRVIKDDPRKYATRDIFVGGWPGGEAGLKAFVAEAEKEKADKKEGPYPASPLRPPARNAARPTKQVGKDPQYVGFAKDELELRKSGAKGRIIYDEDYKYPNKQDIGWLKGAVGGFAGGEKALKDFAESGELRLRRPGEPAPRQFSVLEGALLLSLAGSVSALLASQVPTEEGIKLLPLTVPQLQLLLAGTGVVATGITVIAIRSAFTGVQQEIGDKVQRALAAVAFGALMTAFGYAVVAL